MDGCFALSSSSPLSSLLRHRCFLLSLRCCLLFCRRWFVSVGRMAWFWCIWRCGNFSLVWPSRSAFERTFPPRKWSRNGVVTRGHHCCYLIVVFCNAWCAEQLRSWSREDLVADEQEKEGNWRWGRKKGHERKPHRHRHRHTDREEEKKRKSVWMLWQWWWVYPFVVPPQFLSLSAAPVAGSLARSLRLWMMIALELENPRIQPTRLKQSQCLDLKGGLPLSFSHIPFWDIPIHLWEWMSTSGWSLKKKKKKKKSRKRVNLSLSLETAESRSRQERKSWVVERRKGNEEGLARAHLQQEIVVPMTETRIDSIWILQPATTKGEGTHLNGSISECGGVSFCCCCQ